MKTTLFIYFLFFGIIGYSQVRTKIIEVDLSEPHEKSISVYTESGKKVLDNSKWLSAKCREMIAIKLTHGNPFKYTYKIDTKNISFFNEITETQESISKAKDSAANNYESNKTNKSKTTTYAILQGNLILEQNIDRVNNDLKNFYKNLKQKNTFLSTDYDQRKKLRDDAEKNLTKSFELLMELDKEHQEDYDYDTTRQSLVATKEKAIKNIEKVIHLLYSIDLEIYNLPIDVQGKNIDAVEFKLRRFYKDTDKEDLGFASKPYNIWIKGGLKIDVSAGVFFTSLYDSEFSTKDDPAIAGNKIITLKNGGDYDLAFGSTINTYMRMNSWVVPTLNFGAVVTQNEKLQVLLGIGAILGKQERIIFSTGFSMGKVTRIADSYSVGGSYNLGNSGDVPTQNQFKFGHFFGITYNLTKVKKISLDKGIEQN